MTAPRADGADRTPSAGRQRWAGAAVGSLAVLLLVGLLLRLTIAYVLLPGSGFESDIGTFTAWAVQLGQQGPGSFYASAGFADYPPGYLYVLWLLGGLGNLLGPLAQGGAGAATSALIKLPPMLADIGVGAVLFWMVRASRAGRPNADRLALVAAGLYVLNPVTWYDSAIWGQTDAVGALLILLTIAALVRGNSEGASVLAVLAALTKPQFGVVVLPVVAIVLLRRHLLRPGTNPRNHVLLPARFAGWFETEEGIWRLVSSAVSALVVLLLLLAPFSMDVFRFLNQMAGTAGGYPWLSVNAYNPWALLGAGGADPLAFGGGWSSDTVPLLGPLPGVAIGVVLLVVGFAVGVLRLFWRDDRRSVIVVTIFLALAFFMLPTRVHERYMFPIFALLPLLAVVDRRWMVATIALSLAAFINLHGILTQELYATPNLEHLPFGDLFRQPLGILTSVFLHLGGFVFIAWHMRPSAAPAGRPLAVPEARLSRALATPAERPWSTQPASAVEAGLAAAAPAEVGGQVTVPPDEPGQGQPSAASRWLSALLDRPPARRDRSVLLINEPGGRLGRRDLALALIIFVSSLLLRTYRLEVPYGPHFDEVYHARTAIEFLQDWRYGMPHSIYEFTHPHLAKYLMALGIVTLGNNRVTDTRELGVPATAAAIEERWSPDGLPNARNGDRLYVATGADLRVYDLATRAEVARLPGSIAAVALDESSHTLYTADQAGSVASVSTAGFDDLRTNPAPPPPPTQPLAQLADLVGPLEHLTIAGGQLIATTQGGSIASLDLLTGAQTGQTLIADAAGVVGVAPRAEVFVDPALVTDPAALATTLADLLTDDPARIQGAIGAGGGARTIVAGDVGELVDDLQAAIDDGRLIGVSIESRPLIAVANPAGIALLDGATLTQVKTLATDEPVGGMALVEQGPDVPTVYAASGSQLLTLRLPTDGPAVLGSPVAMPNSVEGVVWNPATTMIHVLGRSQDGASPTVYLVEPRSNAVFADARLAFEPRALVLDAQPDRPAEDRDDLLAISATGQAATVDIGNNQFAYRFPGVLAGALMAVCIYLLARFLFARRSVALMVSLLVLADGMFFANARIAMNDTYVAFFIVAALTLFVPLWLGRWRSRRAIAGGLIAVGVLLGLALASKWVGLYAMGAVGLLILLRSALGRLLGLVAMVGLTALLGYLAITPSASTAEPSLNYMFLMLMVALTAALAAGIALRPMRMSVEEIRLGVVAALTPGPIVLAYGLYRLASGGPPPVLGTFLTPTRITLLGAALTVVGAVVVLGVWYLGRRGHGPLSHGGQTVSTGDPAAPPAPRGWLRPGSGPLGLSWLLALGAILLIPLVVYAISYIPWIELGNRWTADFPAGNTGQTFLDLQRSMYDYHNNLRATHPASSPWWAWPLDLKPVWFEQNDYAGRTTTVIYDTGNLVIFWLAIPAVAWVAWQAWRRRSLALAFVCVAIASLWLPWARIDRATFQYHIFTTLPFSFMALAYFLAELWHGPSQRTWLLARVAAALAVIGAPLLWLLRLPLCGIAGTVRVNADAANNVCGPLSRNLVLTDLQAVGLLLAVGGLITASLLYLSAWRRSVGPSTGRSLLMPVFFSIALLGVVIVVIGAGLGGREVFGHDVIAEAPALVALLLLAVPAYFVLRASDPRKFVIAALGAAVIWFVAFYPNIASLPVPTPLSQIHLGLLPTWNWGFQFAVNLDPANTSGISWSSVALLAVAVIGLCVAAVYAARSWSATRTAGDEVSALPETS